MRRLALVLAVVLISAPSVTCAADLTVSVAISMKEAIQEIGASFARQHSGTRVLYNFGSSGELARQIEAGAPVDVFISAAQREMDALERRGLIVPGTRRTFARNVLTVIKPADSTLDITKPADLLDPRVRRIVIGNPKTVPVGAYAEESLRALGLWDRLASKLIYAENVRQALEYVARGEVDAGWVYVTDMAVGAARVKEAFRPSEDTYRPVVYPAAVVAGSRGPSLARALIDLLTSGGARVVLARFGFQPPPPGAR
jgi:molybdate transport system substrate-binding protein